MGWKRMEQTVKCHRVIQQTKLRICVVLVGLLGMNVLCASNKNHLVGTYQAYQSIYDSIKNPNKLVLLSDSTYKLFEVDSMSMMLRSIGRWHQFANNAIELTSDHYSAEDLGLDYTIERMDRGSQDSVYVEVVFPQDIFDNYFYPIVEMVVNTDTIKAKQYVFAYAKGDIENINQVSCAVNVHRPYIYSINDYKTRIYYECLKQTIDFSSNNTFSLTLSNFTYEYANLQFFYKSILAVSNSGALVWLDSDWLKIKQE